MSSADLDMRFNLIVAATINGKRLGQDHAFYFIVRNNRGCLVTVRDLACIRLDDTDEPSSKVGHQTAGLR